MAFLVTIVLVLFSTKLFGQLSIRFGQPAVLGKLLIGIVLGPAVLSWVNETPVFQEFSTIGVLLLMFLAGLETDTTQLKKNFKPALLVAVIGIIIPASSAMLVGYAFNFDTKHAVFLGVLFAATSVSITVQVLKELSVMKTKEASTVLGAAVVDDILVVILLAFAMSFLGGSGEAVSIPIVLLKKLIFFISIYLIGKFVVPFMLNLFSKFSITAPITTAALILCFATAYFSEMLGMAGIIGTFFIGLFISDTESKKEVEETVEPIANALFVPFFYVSVGLNVSFEGVSSQLLFLVVCTVVAVLSKLLGGYIGAKISGFNRLSSLSIGAGMVSRGEVALILATTGLSSGLLTEEYYTTVIISVILTTLVAPLLLKYYFNKISMKE